MANPPHFDKFFSKTVKIYFLQRGFIYFFIALIYDSSQKIQNLMIQKLMQKPRIIQKFGKSTFLKIFKKCVSGFLKIFLSFYQELPDPSSKLVLGDCDLEMVLQGFLLRKCYCKGRLTSLKMTFQGLRPQKMDVWR